MKEIHKSCPPFLAHINIMQFSGNCCGGFAIGMGNLIPATNTATASITSAFSAWKIETDPDEYSFTVETLNLEEGLRQYEADEITTDAFVEIVMSGLLKTDFSGDGKHWSWDGCSASNYRKEDDFDVYDCEESYTWDWKDIYSVAKASATIGINKAAKRIRVKNYHYYCAG